MASYATADRKSYVDTMINRVLRCILPHVLEHIEHDQYGLIPYKLVVLLLGGW